ncbi:MAG: hypothetical protein LBQ19_00115 [Synergistaceae bacterium]|jgi:hypothetical protein|nr:hypothetical protein [Synergistaceae bacterium]
MEMEFAPQSYLIVQGYIDAKDDRGRTINCTFLTVVSRRDVKYTSVLFGRGDMSKGSNWSDLLALHEETHSAVNRDPLIVHHEEELKKYLDTSLVITGVAKNLNTKPAEQSVSRFCLDYLKLKAVCFVSYVDASQEDLKLFEKDAPVLDAEPASSDAPAGDVVPEARYEEKTERELFIRCDPILDPIGGVATNELSPGDYIYGKLAADSVIYKLLAKNNRGFDGIITAKVSGILMNELGTATISLDLSDGVSGVMKISGKVRVKMALDPESANRFARGRDRFTPVNIPPEFVFIGAGVIVVVSAFFLIWYVLRL